MDDRYSNPRYFGPEDQYQVRGPGSARDHYSSARDYAAAGEFGRGRGQRSGYGASGGYGQGSYGQGGYGSDWDRGDRGYRGDRGGWEASRGQDREQERRYRDFDQRERGDDSDRGFFERAGDEVRSWFGDREAERRRERDMRYDARQERGERWSHGPDDHYDNWRRQRIAELDNDYHEYRRENAQRFENEFNNWRTDRQGQRDGLRRVNEHMEVVGSDGEHVGIVDKVRGDRIILTKTDLASDVEPLIARLKELNPAAPLIRAVQGNVEASQILDVGLYDPAKREADIARWLPAEAYDDHHHHHDVNRHGDIRAFCITRDRPVPWPEFRRWLDALASLRGPDLLRMKGVVNVEGESQPVVLHGVQHVFHPPAKQIGRAHV